MIKILRTVRGLQRNYIFIFQHHISLDSCFCFIILLFSLLVRWLLLYTSCVIGVPYTSNDILIPYQNKRFSKLVLFG
jgi:hypothetical protein